MCHVASFRRKSDAMWLNFSTAVNTATKKNNKNKEMNKNH